jgi:hypothetical protein
LDLVVPEALAKYGGSSAARLCRSARNDTFARQTPGATKWSKATNCGRVRRFAEEQLRGFQILVRGKSLMLGCRGEEPFGRGAGCGRGAAGGTDGVDGGTNGRAREMIEQIAHLFLKFS